MDYKEKYEQVLERANAKIETYNHLGNASVVKSICEIFPELKESENERIRKRIIEFLSTPFVKKGISEGALSTWIDWLEKQGKKIDVIENFDTEFQKQISHLIASTINKEHEYNEGFVKWTANTLLNYAKHELEKQVDKKKVDNVKSKFKTGDWIVYCNETVVLITGIKADGYSINKSGYIPFTCQGNMRLWTIQDAKDGDVLAYENDIVIFKENTYNPEDKSGCMFVYCSCNNFYEIGGINPIVYKPATKKQRDLLFQKMKEAGYEWSDKDRKLIKMK